MLTQNHCFSNGKRGSMEQDYEKERLRLRVGDVLVPELLKQMARPLHFSSDLITPCQGRRIEDAMRRDIAASRFGVGGLLICLRTWKE
jgi:hypothetical protein